MGYDLKTLTYALKPFLLADIGQRICLRQKHLCYYIKATSVKLDSLLKARRGAYGSPDRSLAHLQRWSISLQEGTGEFSRRSARFVSSVSPVQTSTNRQALIALASCDRRSPVSRSYVTIPEISPNQASVEDCGKDLDWS